MQYKIGTIAKKTGLSTNLLRTWELRYDFLSPARGPGKQRLYDEEDLLLLTSIKKKLAAGLSIGELANQGRQALLSTARPERTDQRAATATLTADLQGRSMKQLLEQVSSAAMAVDAPGLNQALQLAFSCLDPADVITKIMEPAMHRLGQGWLQGEVSIAAEHLASNVFSQKMKNLIEAGRNRRRHGQTALCACFPGEEHTLGLLSIAHTLSCHGYEIIFLGSNLPLADLDQAIGQTRPTSVWLSVSQASLYHRHLLELVLLAKKNAPLPFILGGQAVTDINAALTNAGCRQCPAPFAMPDDLLALL